MEGSLRGRPFGISDQSGHVLKNPDGEHTTVLADTFQGPRGSATYNVGLCQNLQVDGPTPET